MRTAFVPLKVKYSGAADLADEVDKFLNEWKASNPGTTVTCVSLLPMGGQQWESLRGPGYIDGTVLMTINYEPDPREGEIGMSGYELAG